MLPLGIVASGRVGASIGAYYDEVTADSPLSYWRHDETSGATSADEMSNYTATWSDTYTRNATPLLSTGKAVSLSGTGQAQAAWGSLAPSAITLESLISLTATGAYQNILDRDDSGSGRSFQFRVTNGQGLEFLWWTVSGGPYFATSSASVVTTGTTYHVAATYAAGVAYVYLNGSQVATGTCTSAALKGVTYPLAIGCTRVLVTGAQRFNGTIDETAVYTSALSAARILAHAQAAGVA